MRCQLLAMVIVVAAAVCTAQGDGTSPGDEVKTLTVAVVSSRSAFCDVEANLKHFDSLTVLVQRDVEFGVAGVSEKSTKKSGDEASRSSAGGLPTCVEKKRGRGLTSSEGRGHSGLEWELRRIRHE